MWHCGKNKRLRKIYSNAEVKTTENSRKRHFFKKKTEHTWGMNSPAMSLTDSGRNIFSYYCATSKSASCLLFATRILNSKVHGTSIELWYARKMTKIQVQRQMFWDIPKLLWWKPVQSELVMDGWFNVCVLATLWFRLCVLEKPLNKCPRSIIE